MDGRIQYTAHINNDSEQTVEEHLLNTAEIAAYYGGKLGIRELMYLCGLLHDMGKLCGDFNAYIHGGGGFSRGQIDHCFAGAKYILDMAKGGSADERAAAELAAHVILSHHGIHDWITEKYEDYLQQRSGKEERYPEIVAAFERIFPAEQIRELLRKAAAEYAQLKPKIKKLCAGAPDKNNMAKRLGFYLGMLERLAESILIDADRTDTGDFMNGRRSNYKAEHTGLWDDMHARIVEKCAAFAQKTDDISKARCDISERCAAFADHRVGICRLIVPTGGGKTMSSMRFAADYCRNIGGERIFYIAPFMSILEQNSAVIRELTGDDDLFLEHYSSFVKEFDSGEEACRYDYHAEHWDSPVISTTLVQLLNTLFLSKTACVRRMHRLCRSVLIIDEVQSLPVRCTHLFDLSMNFLSEVCGTAVVLCSATQPPFESDRKFPLLLDEKSSMTGDHHADFERFRRTRLVDSLRTQGYTYEEAADFCYDRFQENGNVLVIVNTKRAAESLYKLLKQLAGTNDQAEIVHLSTKMCPQHRRDSIDRLRRSLAEERRVICVTTQLIEAGVDISFKCVVRSLAGLDNAAQAAGRCNRSGEYPCCDVFIINITDEELGSLKEIKTAQTASREIMLRAGERELLSVEVMGEYYSALFRERGGELSYPAEDLDSRTDLVDMLSLATVRHDGRIPLTPFKQSFRTAGEIFEVIDSSTRSVIVPYNNEAQQIISELYSEVTPGEALKLLKQAQKYSADLYAPDEKKLCQQGALTLLPCGAAVLAKEYYSEEYGVTLEGGDKELLIY